MQYKFQQKYLNDDKTVELPEGAVGITIQPTEDWAAKGKSMVRVGWKLTVQYLEPVVPTPQSVGEPSGRVQ